MRILSWNIQAGRGADNVLSLERIAASIAACEYPDGKQADIICLQEVARGFPAVTGGEEIDEVAQLQRLFPNHHAIFRPAVDLPALQGYVLDRWQFGSMILSRYPIGQVFNHLLTQRGIDGKGMQRHALEVLVHAPGEVLRIVTTHLEFNSQACRLLQVAQLKTLPREARPQGDPLAYAMSRHSPYASEPRTSDLILCGDLNLLVDSPEYAELTNDSESAPGLVDAWRYLRDSTPHPGTCGWADPTQWPEGPHCRDFFFVTPALCDRLEWIGADENVRASDHQPIMLMMDRRP